MIFAKSYYRHKQFQFDPISKRHLKWQIIKVCCCYRNFFGHAARKNQGIGNDKKMKIFAMTKSQKYLQWQKVENIWNNKSLKTFAMTKNWKYLQWQKFENICDDKRLKIFAMTKSWKYLVVRPSRFCSVTRLTGSTCVEFLDYNPITSSLKYTTCKISQSNYFLLVWELKDWVLSITLRRKFHFLFLSYYHRQVI